MKNQAFDALSLADSSSDTNKPKPMSRSAQWRAEMRERTVVKVSPHTQPGGAKEGCLYTVHVRAGDTEPFTVHRSADDLRELRTASQEAYTEKGIVLPAFPTFCAPGDKVDEQFLAMSSALLQSWLEESVAVMPTAAEKIIFLRACEADPRLRTHAPIVQGQIARGAATAKMAAKMAMNGVWSKFFKDDGELQDGAMSEANIELLVEHLCTMRGAMLKVIQFELSRDTGNMDPALKKALKDRVLNRTFTMPPAQVEELMSQELGADWASKFTVFDKNPFAAASLGQVHSAAQGDANLAVKLQFPGVSQAIEGDVDTMDMLLKLTARGGGKQDSKQVLSVRKATWLAECSYLKEASNLRKYVELMQSDVEAEHLAELFDLPQVLDDISTERVLAMRYVSGTTLNHLCGSHVAEAIRNSAASSLFKIKMREMFHWRFLNTDLHMGNFVFNSADGINTFGLLDFGACETLSFKGVQRLAQLLVTLINADAAAAEQSLSSMLALQRSDSQSVGDFFDEVVPNLIYLAAPLRSAEPFDFERWSLDPKINHGLMQKINRLQNKQKDSTETRAKEMGLEEFDYALVRVFIDRFTIVLLHCAHLKAKISVQDDFFKALDAVNVSRPKLV